MADRVRVVHYINQAFAGIGGEEHADRRVELRDGVVGASRALQQALRDAGTVVATIVCGDNYAVEEPQALEDIRAALAKVNPDLVIAGPAFDAGRYGVACTDVCAIAEKMGIPAVTGMDPENPGRVGERRRRYIVPTGSNATEMATALRSMVALGMELVRGEEVGPAATEGYLPRGIRKLTHAEKPGYERAVEILMARIQGRPFRSEVPLSEQNYEQVPPAPSVRNLSEATIAFVVSAGIVPMGNPDKLPGGHSEDIYPYSIDGVEALEVGTWMSAHGGFNTTILNTIDPNYALPLFTLRALEREGVIGKIHPYFYSTVGAGTGVRKSMEMGARVARELKEAGVNAVLEVAT